MKRIYFYLMSLFLFLSPGFAFSESNFVGPGSQVREINFGKVTREQIVQQSMSMYNTSDTPWVIDMIEVSGPGFRLVGMNHGKVPAQASASFGIEFIPGLNAKRGKYLGKCKFYMQGFNGQQVFEYALKAQVVDK